MSSLLLFGAMVAAIAYATYQVSQTSASLRQVTEETLPPLIAIDEVQRSFDQSNTALLRLLSLATIGIDDKTVAKRADVLEQALTTAIARFEAYEQRFSPATAAAPTASTEHGADQAAEESAEQAPARPVKELVETFVADARDFKEMALIDASLASIMVEQVENAYRALDGVLSAEAARQIENAHHIGAYQLAAAERGQWIVIVIAAVSGVLGLGACFVVMRGVTHPISAMVDAMRRLADGATDIAVVGEDRGDEVGAMARAIAVFRERAIERADLAAKEQAQRAEEQALAAAEALLQSNVARVVAAARSGDFSQRVDEGSATGALRELASGVNAVVQTVNAATQELSAMLQALASGDLSARVTGRYAGVFEGLAGDANATAERLGRVVAAISDSTAGLRRSTAQVTGSAHDIQAGAETQAASLEETAATMHELAQSVSANADSAVSANAFCTQVATIAQDSSQIAQSALDAMARINEGAQKVSATTSVVDSIAFQTNLLALNAAVEAARAGAAGQGFAVVAAEVRGLAQRASEAAQEISHTVSESAAAVSEGVELVTASGAALAEIETQVADLSRAIEAITTAGADQANGLSEVSSAMAALDQTTQLNARVAAESAGAATALETEAKQLERAVAFFNGADQATSPAAAAA